VGRVSEPLGGRDEAATMPGTPANRRARLSRPQRQVRVCLHAAEPLRGDLRGQRAASTLSAAGYAVTVVDVEHGDTPASLAGLGEQVHVRHIKMPRWTQPFYKPTRPIPWLLFKIWRWGRSLGAVVRTPADAYQASDLAALPACYLAARLRRKPLIFDSHEFPLVEDHIVRRRLLYGVSRRFLRRALRRSDGFLVVSPPIGDEMHRLYGGPPPVVLRNIPPYQPRVESDRLREHLALQPQTRIALYQGGLDEDRGLDTLVHAGKFLPPDMVIVLMGKGPSKPHLEELIAGEGVGDRVRMLPAVPYAELLAWTASADLGLIVYPTGHSPNILYCLPNKLFEFLMAGLPVLASPLVAIADVLRSYDVGRVVSSMEPSDVGQAIGAMLADSEALARMRRNALQATRQELCWEVEQQRLLSLYASLPR
jgi:glycosyltransferase involved in cell wall biosynthesis